MDVSTIVIGYDGSANGRKALEAAVDLVADDGVVHVVTAFDGPGPVELSEFVESLPDEFRQAYDPLSTPRGHLKEAEVFLEQHGVDHDGRMVEDHPAAAILDVAEEVDADMIIVGSRGIRRGTRFIRGSVSSRIANYASASFLVVRGDEE